MSASGRLAATTLIQAIAAASLLAQGQPDLPPGAEGPLSNDCFLPTSAAAGSALRAGDEVLTRAREAAASARPEAERLLIEALETWHEALAQAPVASSVWVEPASVGERRLTEGLWHAVVRRLDGLATAERRQWRARFAEAARAELEDAGVDAGRLAEVARRHPGTPAAARAYLLVGDRAHEEGRLLRARTSWKRAAAEARRIGAQAEHVRAAAERRQAASAARQSGAPEAWARATALVPLGGVALSDPESRLAAHRIPLVNGGVRPGLAFLGDGRIAVQTTSRVHVLGFDDAGRLRGERTFLTAELLPEFSLDLDVRDIGRRPPGWSLTPTAVGNDLLLVVGRSRRGSEESNALVRLRPPVDVRERGELAPLARDSFLPQLAWAVVGDLLVSADATVATIAELADIAPLELQPGPIVAGTQVLIQARSYAGEVRAWLFAFDLENGRLRWRRLLASGSDLVPDLGRLGADDLHMRPRMAGQPLLLHAGAVFVGTNLGAGALLEASDGRPLWSLRNRRRAALEPGWDGGRPMPAEGAAATLLWAPFDSDRLYFLRSAPVLQGETAREALFTEAPRGVGESVFLLGGDPAATVVLGRAGAERTVSELRAPGMDRLDALYLGPDEDFPGRGLATQERVYASTDRGLYLFDRTRELYLLDYAALEPVGSVTRGGELYARGDLVLALSRDGLWGFRTR